MKPPAAKKAKADPGPKFNDPILESDARLAKRQTEALNVVKFLCDEYHCMVAKSVREAFERALRRGNDLACQYLVDKFKVDINSEFLINEQDEGFPPLSDQDSDDETLTVARPIWFALRSVAAGDWDSGAAGQVSCHTKLLQMLLAHPKIKTKFPMGTSSSVVEHVRKEFQDVAEDRVTPDSECLRHSKTPPELSPLVCPSAGAEGVPGCSRGRRIAGPRGRGKRPPAHGVRALKHEAHIRPDEETARLKSRHRPRCD